MLKSKSKDFVDVQNSQHLSGYIKILAQKQQQMIREKIDRMHQKQQRSKTIERQFVDWVEKKEELMQTKLAKSEKNKEQHINKIIKKCKDQEKYYGQKWKNYQTKKKISIRQAWRKAQKFNSDLQNYRNSKMLVKSKSKVKDDTEISNEMSQSLFMPSKILSTSEKNDFVQMNSPSNIRITNQSKNIANPSYINNSYINQSQFINFNGISFVQKVKLDINFSGRKIKEELQEEIKQKFNKTSKLTVGEKVKDTLERFQKKRQDSENHRIQLLGERLQKIQKHRIKRVQSYKRRRLVPEKTIDEDQDEVEQKKDRKATKRKQQSQRVRSQVSINEKRTHNWSVEIKNKQQQHFLKKLEEGNQYLEQQRLRYLKNMLAKKISKEGIQKKLYIERLPH